MRRLDEVDLSQDLSKEEYGTRLTALQERVAALRIQLGGHFDDSEPRLGVLLLLEGWDASGKSGAVKRLVAELDAGEWNVAKFRRPTEDDWRHHYLRRFWPSLPGPGELTIFDRTWYGRVLVERVEGYATSEQWTRAYDEIVALERTLAISGTIICKAWFHLSPEEQLRRFERRERRPLKRWKLTEEDWRNRDKRGAYEEAAEEMIERTDHPHGRWHLIAAESKRFARVQLLEAVIREIEDGMRSHGVEPVDVAAV